MRIASMVLAAGLALVCGSAQSQAYRWVDKDGKVQYGDVAPPGVKAKMLKPPAEAAAPAADTGKAGKEGAKIPISQEQAFEKRQVKAKEEAEKAAKAEAGAERKKRDCASAQENLRTLQSGRRIATVNAQGESVVLDDAQIQERLGSAREAASKLCN